MPLASGAEKHGSERPWAGGGVAAAGAAEERAGVAIGTRVTAAGAFTEREPGEGWAGAGRLEGAGGGAGGGGGGGVGGVVAAGRGKGTSRETSVKTLAPFAEATFSFSLTDIHTATSGFHPSNLIGRGGSSQVFRGCLPGGKLVAVKIFDSPPGGERDFITEARLLSRLNHKNVVKLLGTCDEGGLRCLVFQLAEKGSLREHLHSSTLPTSTLPTSTLPTSTLPTSTLHSPTLPSSLSTLSPTPAVLDWSTRVKIALGAAQGLAYLHEDSSPQIIHRDLKTSNILLDADWTARIADLGLARVVREKKAGVESQHMRGTFGYMAPEYALTGRVAPKSDVFSFGVVLLEVLSGRPALVPLEPTQATGPQMLLHSRPQLLEVLSGRPALVPLEPTQATGDAAAAVDESAEVLEAPSLLVRAYPHVTCLFRVYDCVGGDGGKGDRGVGVSSIVVWAKPLLSSYVHTHMSHACSVCMIVWVVIGEREIGGWVYQASWCGPSPFSPRTCIPTCHMPVPCV
ncbi:unnamed protein product [Closterium sp. Yama58-4]|nr:unnamed protein product [Closterium sp. Yama58-4]